MLCHPQTDWDLHHHNSCVAGEQKRRVCLDFFLFFFIYIYFFKDHFWTFPQGNIGSKNIVGSEDGVKVSGKEIIYLVVVGLLNNWVGNWDWVRMGFYKGGHREVICNSFKIIWIGFQEVTDCVFFYILF